MVVRFGRVRVSRRFFYLEVGKIVEPLFMPEVSYVAYIDESGDDGVASVRPRDPKGATEWFVLSAVVVRADAQRETVWVRDILRQIKLDSRRELHFQPLNSWRKAAVCNCVANLPLRCFVAISNKVNMEGHRNPRAEKVSAGKTWFYWWMTRLLLERVRTPVTTSESDCPRTHVVI